jgi:hypothetical protein
LSFEAIILHSRWLSCCEVQWRRLPTHKQTTHKQTTHKQTNKQHCPSKQ